jgi:hypothetical protein
MDVSGEPFDPETDCETVDSQHVVWNSAAGFEGEGMRHSPLDAVRVSRAGDS